LLGYNSFRRVSKEKTALSAIPAGTDNAAGAHPSRKPHDFPITGIQLYL
jgi:hypothetical protein